MVVREPNLQCDEELLSDLDKPLPGSLGNGPNIGNYHPPQMSSISGIYKSILVFRLSNVLNGDMLLRPLEGGHYISI